MSFYFLLVRCTSQQVRGFLLLSFFSYLCIYLVYFNDFPGSYGESNSMLLDESTVVPSDNKIDEES